jgi:hypothetical protein
MPRQLPAGACISHAIQSVRNNIGYAFRISWPWYAVVFAINLAVGFLSESLVGDPMTNPGGSFALQAIVLLVNLVSFASIAVNWHRYILLDQVPAGGEILRLDGLTWRYLGNLVLIWLMFFIGILICMFVLQLFAGLSTLTAIMAFFVGLAVLLFGLMSFYRLSVKLPSVAIGRRDFSLSDAWTATQGNWQPLLLIVLFMLLLGLALLLVIGAVSYVLISVNAILGVVIGVVILTVLTWLLSIFGVTMLTSFYGFFVEGRDF